MKIELKSIKFSEAMSEETNAFTANLYINGKKVGYCKNTGQGGCTDYNADSPELRPVIAEAEAHFKAMPKYVPEGYNFELQPTLEGKIDDLFQDWLKAKDNKKIEKLMLKTIFVGLPNTQPQDGYRFKVPLSTIPVNKLQASVDRIKAKLNKGETILNTNLQALGVTV